MREAITACVITYNEEDKIRRCLQSVKWCDEIIVVDSFSTDKTVDIAREFTSRVYTHEWMGYIGQKNLTKDMASSPWILFIDADEEVSPRLRDEILREFESGASEKTDGYECPRKVFFLGKWISHGDWYPDRKLRLFRKAKGKCHGMEPHDRVVVDGRVRKLRGDLLHYTYDNIEEQVSVLNKYSSITAEGWRKEGQKFRLGRLILHGPCRFLRSYLLKLGFLDGVPGLVVATISATGVFIKYAKLWELYHGRKAAQGTHSKASS